MSISVAERHSHISRTPFNERQSWHSADGVGVRSRFLILKLQTQKQFSIGIQRPWVGDLRVFLRSYAPDFCWSTLSASTTLTFAKTGAPNSRSSQMFINLGDNPNLDGQGFAPFGRVVSGMDVVDAINAEYGQQPSQQSISERGNEYLNEKFPNLDYIKSATIEE